MPGHLVPRSTRVSTLTMQIRSRSRSLADNPQLLGLLLTLPALIAILAVVLIPIFSSFLLSLQQKDLSRPQYDAFIGFKNYLTLLRDSRYLNSLWVTFRFSLTSVILEVILGVSIALVL